MYLIENLLSMGGFLTINKTLIKKTSLKEAALLQSLISKRQYFRNRNELDLQDGFFVIMEYLTEELGLSSKSIRRTYQSLSDKGLLIVKKKGMPSKNYYYIQDEAIIELLDQSGQKGTTSEDKKEPLVRTKGHTNNNKYNNNKVKELSNYNINPVVDKKPQNNKVSEELAKYGL